MQFKKKDLLEIIDSNGDLIGGNDIPTNGSNLETQANNTTDYNVKIGQQPFRYDMLGRFGFTLMPFMEGKENQGQIGLIDDLAKLMYDKYMEILEYYYRNPNKLKPDFRLHSEHDFENRPEKGKKTDLIWAKKIMKVIEPHFEKAFKEPNNIDEAKVVEDKVVGKKNEDEITEKGDDKEVRSNKIEKIAGLINKLDKKDIDKLINLLERKSNG
jgi:hypothetical protein